MFSITEKKEAIRTYGSGRDEVCYAHKRLEKIGVNPYEGEKTRTTKGILEDVIELARKSNKSWSVYLENMDVWGLFVITPGSAPVDTMYQHLVQNAEKERWDKPIEEQKKEEEFDRFKTYEYQKEVYEKYGAVTDELCYADERIKQQGIKPCNGRNDGTDFEMFTRATLQAELNKEKVAVFLDSGRIRGLFVVSPDERIGEDGYLENKFESYVKNQKKYRYDKPIPQQKAEQKLHTRQMARE